MARDDNQAMSPLPSASTLPQGTVALTDWGLIRASGAEAATFLNGQLTQDILHLPAGLARLAGYCSAKGRLLATFVVWRRGDEEVLLACSADVLPAVLKRLTMFVMRAKCRLSDASAEVPLWGLAGAAAAPAPATTWGRAAAGEVEFIRLPAAHIDGIEVPRALAAGPLAAGAPVLDPQAWCWLEVLSGTARVCAATSEQFVPQMVNLELVGGVNFQKGCYPGQEVVARSQYRGTLKRRAYVLLGDAPLQPGEEVFHSTDPSQPAGMVVNGGSIGPAHAALVELKIAALQGGTLHAGSAQGPLLRPAALPYDIPAPEAA
jgi:folate-binding protein YgfZ